MKSTESIIAELYDWRKDKMATCVALGVMCDSIPEAVERIKSALPTMKKMEEESRPQKYRKKTARLRLEIDHDVASRVADLFEELLPWLEKLATLEAEESAPEEILGLA